jgi:hypothetical protein
MHLGDFLGLAGLAGWVGWAAGVGALVFEVRKWRSDRREGPVMRELVERELRDKKGVYTEEQIKAMTGVVESLTRQARIDVPIVARRTFIESQREQLASSIDKDFREYKALGKKLGDIPSVSVLSSEVRESIRAEIAPSVERRDRQLRGVVAVVVVVGLLVVFPYPQRFVGTALYDVFGSGNGYVEQNVLSYTVGIAVTFIFAVYSSWSHFQARIVRTPVPFTVGVAVGCLCLWLLGLVGILRLWIVNPGVQNFVAIVSLVLFGIGVRIFYLLFRWRRVGVD